MLFVSVCTLVAESEARCPKELRDLIVDCWDADPKRRPAAKEIWGILSMMRKVCIPDPP
jgi:hypothetical protein